MARLTRRAREEELAQTDPWYVFVRKCLGSFVGKENFVLSRTQHLKANPIAVHQKFHPAVQAMNQELSELVRTPPWSSAWSSGIFSMHTIE